jgi:putative ABC transport system permease protein
MNKGFYFKMAVGNIRKNKNIYRSYLLAVSLVTGMFYILCSLQEMVQESDMIGRTKMTLILNVCIFCTALFALIILFYVNYFVMKQRKKEWGLYSILGMEKRHLARLVVAEVLLIAAGSLLLGILSGILFSQLVFLIFLNMIRMTVTLQFSMPVNSVNLTVKFFGSGFLLVILYNLMVVIRTNPIRMLQESRAGEREPKTRWILALLGALFLGAGYGIAWSVETPLDAMVGFFGAAVLVMIGTYFLFVAGSIVILKVLKKWERFYYRPGNFISVSGMLYRMRQNAVSLASICILSTGVIATLASCFSIVLGLEDGISMEYPRRVYTSCLIEDSNHRAEEQAAILKEAVRKHSRAYGVSVKNELGYMVFSTALYQQDGQWNLLHGSDYNGMGMFQEIVQFQCLTAEDYRTVSGQELELEKGETAVWESTEGILGDRLELFGLSYKISERIPKMELSENMQLGSIEKRVQVIFADMETLHEVREAYQKEFQAAYGDDLTTAETYKYFFDVDGTASELSSYFASMRDGLGEVPRLAVVQNRDAVEAEYIQDYGTILFVGIFLTVLFLIVTVLIIYYKQITEGYDDRKRFEIMQQVGMGREEVKKVIRRQVVMVFFLPLIVAVLHIAVAFKALVTMMTVFMVYNKPLFFGCVAGTAAVFGVIYFMVYGMTARTYYRIVKL